MKPKLALLWILAPLLFSALACSAGAREVSVAVSCDEFQEARQVSREVEMRVGDSLKLALCSNPTTGFQWEPAAISDPSVLQQVGQGLQPPAEGGVGAPGRQEWSFRAIRAGSSSVAMQYSRPWPGGEKGVWTFDLKVVAR